MIFLFFFSVIAVLLAMNYLSYKLFLKNFNEKGARIFCILLSLAEFSFFFAIREKPSELIYMIWGLSYILAFYLFLFALLRFFIFKSLPQKSSIDLERRRFLKLSFDMYLLIIAFLSMLKGFFEAVKMPALKKTDIFIKNANTLKIVLLSDIHLGSALGRDFLLKLIEKSNEQNPDVVVIAGDLLDDANLPYLQDLELLKAKYANIFVYGNHEYYSGFKAVKKALGKIKNLIILENESIEIAGFTFSGISDLGAKRFGEKGPDFKALNPKKDKINILISHQPKVAKIYDISAFDLILSGHTHAGQVFPLHFLVLLDQGFLQGLYKIASSQIYVSAGAGYWGPALRFLAPSEIAILTIKDIK